MAERVVGETLGRCKWFNGRKGYGFLTTVGTENPTDVFVHHSNVNVGEEQYKYLVEGEYVSFNLTESNDSEHKHQASNVTGVHGGKLMCELVTTIAIPISVAGEWTWTQFWSWPPWWQ